MFGNGLQTETGFAAKAMDGRWENYFARPLWEICSSSKGQPSNLPQFAAGDPNQIMAPRTPPHILLFFVWDAWAGRLPLHRVNSKLTNMLQLLWLCISLLSKNSYDACYATYALMHYKHVLCSKNVETGQKKNTPSVIVATRVWQTKFGT